MEHETSLSVQRPPLRTFEVLTKHGDVESGVPWSFVTHLVEAHLVFNNTDRGDSLVFRRYYDDSVRTEKVAEFPQFEYYKEVK